MDNFLPLIQNKLNQFKQAAMGAVQNFTKPAPPPVANPTQTPLPQNSMGYNFWHSPIGQGLVNIQQSPEFRAFTGGSTLGLGTYQNNAPQFNQLPTTRKITTGLAYGAGMLNPGNPINKLGVFSKIGALGERAIAPIAEKVAAPLISKGISAVGSELAQTAAYGLASKAAGQPFDPVTGLAMGLGARGVLGAAGAGMGKGFVLGKMHPEDMQAVRDIADIYAKDPGYAIKNYSTDLYRLGGRYLDTPSKVGRMNFNEVLNGLVDRHNTDLQYPSMGLVNNKPQPIAPTTPEFATGQVEATQVGKNKIASILRGVPPSQPPPPSSFNANDYINELSKKQDQARQGEKLGLGTNLSNFYNKLKEQLVNAQAPIEDVVTAAEKKNKFQVLPKQDIRLQIDRSLRSEQLGGQFMKDNGLVDTIQKAPDLKALDQYMIAKQAQAVERNGIRTGRDLGKDQQLVDSLAPIYEPYAQQVNQYSRKLLDYSVQSGLVSKDTADMLVKKYPDYVPINRIFNEDELVGMPNRGSGKGVASLSKQTVVQRLKGSEREIDSPIGSLVAKTKVAFDQGERNIAAQQLATYRNIPGNPFGISEVKEGEAGQRTTFSALINGEKHTYQTTPEVAAAAKSLNKEQMGLLARIVSVPTRMLRLGATGLNYPFAIANLAKDQVSAYLNSKNSFATSNPIAFTKGLFAALGHGQLYDDVVRSAGGGTSYDIGREAPQFTVAQIRRGGSTLGKIANVVKSPIRTAEDLIGRTEELTRAQQFHGTYDNLIKQGRTPEDARLLAAQAARENTVNFARGGSFSRVINWVIPYFNAGVQGSRTLVRNISTRPAQTLTKFAIGVGMPVAAATIWNLSDPQRKQAYQDIPDFEKQNSIVIVPPNPTKNADGTWNVIKIPLSQEIASLSNLVRRPLEQSAQMDPVSFGEIANDLFQAGTSLNSQTPSGLISSLTPQIAKPGVEAVTNTNLFTGQKIVPDYLKNLPANEQVKKNTSGTARIIGAGLNTSPLIIQNEAQTVLGGLGPQVLNASDRVLNKAGLIPDNQVGGKSFGNALQKRFLVAQGGDIQNKMNSQLMQGLNPKETEAYNLLHTPRQVDAQGNPIQDNTILNSQQKALIYLNYPNLQAIDAIKEQANPQHDPIWDLSPQQRNLVLASRVQLPGQKNTYDSYLSRQPWYPGFLQAQSTFFNSLPATSQPTTPPGGLTRPLPDAYTQKQMDLKNWRDPQVQAYFKALDTFNNSQLTQLGLPATAGTTGGSGGSRFVLTRLKQMARRPMKKGKVKRSLARVKTSNMKFKLAKIKKPKAVKLAGSKPSKFKV